MWLTGVLCLLIGLGLRGMPSMVLLILGAGLILLRFLAALQALGWL